MQMMNEQRVHGMHCTMGRTAQLNFASYLDGKGIDCRERASVIAASSMSSDERNKRHVATRGLMPPPRPSTSSFPNSIHEKSRFGSSISRNSLIRGAEMSTSSNTSKSTSGSSSNSKA
ncbi:hypothetical protein V6N12_007916 [Hibiscus sabdariffa]|uniref:Uncharacterized protein n=1 Tax=Hibiscus sabdariffa TaxID=183260 RepID=A0ABR2APB8_9ROSI